MNTPIRQRILRRYEAIVSAVEQKWPWLLALYIALFLVITLLLDWKRPFWNDELFTFYISRRPTLGGVWSALMTGAEQLPLFFFVIIRLFTSALGASTVAYRLPETLGCLVMNISVFLFVRKHVSASYGLVAFIFPAITDAYFFAYEARPYGLVMGFCGLAMLCWQSAAQDHSRNRSRLLSLIGMALFLACAINCHYYAVLTLFPFGLAELVRLWTRRRLDFPMYLAIAASLAPLTLSLSVIRAASGYSTHFWAKPSWTSLISFYENLLLSASLALMLIVLAAGAYVYLRGVNDHASSAKLRIPVQDLALACGFALLPVVAISLAKVSTGAFTSRYAIYAIIGLSVLLAWSLARIGDNRALLGITAALLTLSCWLVIAVREYQRFGWNQADQAQMFEFLSKQRGNLPLVMASPHQFFVQSHRAAHQGKGHFVFLADVPLAIKYTDTDTVERGLLTLKHYAPLDVQDFSSFVGNHPQFLVYGYPDPFGWILQELMKAGRPISVVDRNGDSLLYLVGPLSGSASLRTTAAP